MTLYPPKLGHDRLAEGSKQTQRRLKALESRTSSIDSGFPLALLPGVIGSSYTTGTAPQVYVNGATTLSGPFQYLSSYTPAANDAVLLAPVGVNRTYVILGKLLTS